MEANPKYIRESTSVLGLEAVYRTAVGKLFYMCQERADIMYSVKETARKITCSTESDEMNVMRIARYLKGVQIAKCLIEINRFSPFLNVYTDSDWEDNTKRAKAQAVESRS